MGKSVAVPTIASGKDNSPRWIKVTDQAEWRPRDSQGEVVYKNRMWILGGWFGNEEPCPRDVWSSSDGKIWKLVRETAPWKHGDLPMTLVFQDKMWLMGGWYNGLLPGHSAGDQVWWSSDGKQWKQVRQNAGWTPRLAAGAVVFKEKMWILGGIEDYKTAIFGIDDNYAHVNPDDLKNGVWCSEDGIAWELATKNAGWSPRAFHQAIVFEDKIWVLGGATYRPKQQLLNDVWCSDDGVNWIRVTQAAPWGPRSWFSSIVYRDRMWVLGGFSDRSNLYQHLNHGDVWYSNDGKNWTELKSEVMWTARHEHSTLVFQDKIWIAGGKRDVPRLKAPTAETDHPQALVSEVWSLYIPENWFNDE